MCATAFAAADLEIQSLTGVMTHDGSQVQLVLRLTNHGPEPANHFGCNIYIYSNDRLLVSKSLNLPAIAAVESREENLGVQIPSPLATSVKAEIYDAQQPDLQPSTNTMRINLKPLDYKKVDLEIVEAAFEAPGMIRLRLRNNGPERIGGSRLVAELVVFGNTIAKTEKRIGRLVEGEETELKLPVPTAPMIPSTQGTIRLDWLPADPSFSDIQPENNTYELSAALILKMPDLFPKNITIDKRGALSFSVINGGKARAETSTTALYVNGALIQRYDTPELRPNGSQQYRYTAKVVPDAKITVVTDFNADVEESSEENNRLNYQPKRLN